LIKFDIGDQALGKISIRQMKVLHVIPSISELRGGTSSAILDMVKTQLASGITAHITTTNDNGPDILDVPLGSCTEYEGISVFFFNRFSPGIPSVREFALSWPLTRWLLQHIVDYDLIHVHALFSYASTTAMMVARLRKIPYVVTTHGLLCEWAMSQSQHKKRIYLSLIERANLNRAQALHFTSNYEQQQTSKIGLKAPQFVVPLGLTIPAPIPDARQRLREWLKVSEDETVILFMSRLHPVKGLDYLIPALAKLADYRFTFILAGSGTTTYEAELQDMLIKANIDSRTRCVGFVQGERKDILLQGADLFVQTSKMESFGIAVLEALASGTPVLVTQNVAIAEEISTYHLGYVTKLDSSLISDRLSQILEHSAEARERGNSARDFIYENYTWDHVISGLANMYRKIKK